MKYDRVIKNWQVHNLDLTEDLAAKIKAEGYLPMMVTGTVVEDPTEKFKPGWHMRSTLVKSIDRDKGLLVTRTKTYKLEGTEGKDVVPDLGNKVLYLFY